MLSVSGIKMAFGISHAWADFENYFLLFCNNQPTYIIITINEKLYDILPVKEKNILKIIQCHFYAS